MPPAAAAPECAARVLVSVRVCDVVSSSGSSVGFVLFPLLLAVCVCKDGSGRGCRCVLLDAERLELVLAGACAGSRCTLRAAIGVYIYVYERLGWTEINRERGEEREIKGARNRERERERERESARERVRNARKRLRERFCSPYISRVLGLVTPYVLVA